MTNIAKWLVGLGLGFAAGLPVAAAVDWQAVECLPADPAQENAYQITRVVDGFETDAAAWRATAGGQQAKAAVVRDEAAHHEGRAAMRVDYEFVGKKDYEYIHLHRSLAFGEPGMGIGFWLKSDGTPFILCLRVTDKSGECHQTELAFTPKPGWQFVVGKVDATSSSWGGDGNHQRDYPCQLDGICIDRPKAGFTGKGSLWLDEFSLVRPLPRDRRTLKVEVAEKHFGNGYAVGESVSLRATGPGESIRWSVADFFGQTLAAGSGPGTSAVATFSLPRPGWFACQLDLCATGRVVDTQFYRLAVFPAGAPPAPADFVGVCTHYGQGSYPLETMELMQRYGINQFRDEISWGSYESQKGRLALPGYGDRFLQHAADLKMRPLIIFDYANKFYDGGGYPNSPEAIAAFAAYAVDLARQTRGRVAMFEIWNEWVGGCGMDKRPGKHDGEAYGNLLKPTYAAVKKAFPDLTVVGIGGEYGTKCAENILGAIKNAGPQAMDAWSIHPYRYPHPPEESDLMGEVGRIAARVASAGATQQTWITEIGYPTHITRSGSSLQAQANYAVRTLALLQSMPVVGKVFWYDLKDDGFNREYNEDNFGLIHHQRFNCAPKPAIVAVGTFNRLTGGAQVQPLQRHGQQVAAAYRRKDGTEVLMVWSAAGPASISVTGQLQERLDIMGNRLAGQGAVALSGSPVYWVGKNLRITWQ